MSQMNPIHFRTRCMPLTLILLLVVTVTVNSQTEPLKHEVEVRGVYTIPSGEASFTRNGINGSELSLDRDFDFQNELGFELRYTHRTASGKHKFQVGYNQTTWERTANLSRSFTFLGETYVANLDIDAEFRLSTFRGMYSYRWGNDKIRIGPMVDMGVVNVGLDITGTTNTGTRTGSGSRSKFAATIGYDLDYDPSPRINIFNNLGIIAFQGDRVFHVEGGVRVFATRNFGFSGGYKAERYKYDVDPDLLKIDAHGPFFGGVLRF